MSDIFDDLLDGVPPWEYNDDVTMGDATPSPMDFEFPTAVSSRLDEGHGEESGPKESIEFPPHWAELMEQIRVREEAMKRVIMSRRSGESVSPANPDQMLPPSGYALLPPMMNAGPGHSEGSFQPPHVPYPHLPFWTAAPLPFSPGMYPVNVLPPNARESVLAPKAPPLPQTEVKKKKRPGRKPKAPGRPRDARGLFTRSPEDPETKKEPVSSSSSASGSQQALVSKIQELQKQLLESRYESVILREQLVHSQMELSQLKDRGLVKSTIRGYHHQPTGEQGLSEQPTQSRSANASGNANTAATSPPLPGFGAMDAFRVQLDYNQLKSKLRPTNNGHYDGPASVSPRTSASASVSEASMPPEAVPFQFVLDE